MIALPDLVTRTVEAHPHPLLFATISGAHLYGFPSPDSDYDIRGAHILPARDLLGLVRGRDTIETMLDGPPEVDLVTHDVEKFLRLLLRPNGYVLEQLYSPLVVTTTPAHAELRELARGCITRHHVHHYVGFADNQWQLFEKEHPRRVKPLLYVFRVLLTGIHLMRTGEIEANLVTLNESAHLAFLESLIARKLSRAEQQTIGDVDVGFYRAEVERLRETLIAEAERSALPDEPGARAALHEFLLRVRGLASRE